MCKIKETIAADYKLKSSGIFVGNGCDRCAKAVPFYQVVDLPLRYEVRATPNQHDADRDGVGDACDNCPSVPNCLEYGDGPGLVPHTPGAPLDPEDPGCQSDVDQALSTLFDSPSRDSGAKMGITIRLTMAGVAPSSRWQFGPSATFGYDDE